MFSSVNKLGHVTPICKTGKRNQIGDYRPITMLPVTSKVDERAVCNRLIPFFSENKTIVGNQFGFQSELSTADTICSVFQNIRLLIV